MTNVGYATLQIIPSVRGIGDELRRQLVGPAGDSGEQAGEAAGGGFRDAFTGALAAIGVTELASGLGGKFTDAFSQALEQGNISSQLSGQLGSSGPTAARQGAEVGQLFAKGVTENFEQGAEAVRAIVSGGLVPPDATVAQLDLIGAKFTDVANTFGTDMGLQSQAISALLKNQLAPNASVALDIITTGFQKLGPNAEDLLETFQEYPIQLRKLGIDANQAIGLFRQGIQGGARDTDIIADAFKEFSIRAIDMSTTSQDAYKLIGLNAEKMSLQISKGGEGANAGLQLVLDRLRAIKDPVKQSAAAVGLFGTQAEDLGAAFFKLDPGKATTAFGDVTGAAEQLGKTLHSGPSHELTVFTRALQQGFVTFLGGQVLPILADWGSTLNQKVLPPLMLVGGFLASLFLPTLALLGGAISGTVAWLREWGAWLIPVGVAIVGLTVLLNASAIATAAVTAVFALYRGVLIAAAAVTRGYAVAQGILNAVLTANPIGLIIVGIAALVALLVVAYNKSDTFRRIVQAAWSGIQAGWSVLWTSVLKPGIDAFMLGLRQLGAAASWLWTTILSPVFSFIGLAAKVLFAIVATILIVPLVLLFRVLAAVVSALWTNAVSPIFTLIGALAVWLYATVLKPAFDQVMATLRAVGAVASWLWTNAVKPAFDAIGQAGTWLYNNVLKPAFTQAMTTFRALGSAASWLWTNAVRPAFDSVGSKVSWLYDNVIKPVMDKGKAAIGLFGTAFSLARDAIGKAWDQVSGIAKKPINFIIKYVYTEGIKAVWDKVAGFVGLGKLPAAPKLLAAGGTVGNGWGPAAPMKVNRPTAIVGEGSSRHPEYVIPTDPRYRSRALALHAAAGTQLMADGGIIGGVTDWIGGTAKKVGGAVMSGVDFLSDPGKLWDEATKFIRDKIAQIGAAPFPQMIGKVPIKMLGGLKDKIVSAATSVFGGGGGGGTWARPVSAPLGTRYGVRGSMWSSGYHTGTDFPAPTGTAVRAAAAGIVQSVLSGGPYGNHLSILHGAGLSSMYAHMSSMGVRSGQRVTKGAQIGAVGATGNTTGPHLHFEARRGGRTINPEPLLGYSNGGRPPVGDWAWVGENGPELLRFGSRATVYPHEQSVRMAAGMAGARAAASSVSAGPARAAAAAPLSAAPSGLSAGDRLRLVVEGREFEAYVEDVADGRIESTLRPVAAAIAGRRG